MSSGIIIAHNLCYVPKFTLFIHQSTKEQDKHPVEDFLKNHFARYEIFNAKQNKIQKDIDLVVIEGKISFGEKKAHEEGFIKFIANFKEIENAIFLKYQITDKIEKANQLNNLIEELHFIKFEFESSLLNSEQNYLVNNFLRPHRSGIQGDLFRLSHPVEISYELEGKYLLFKNQSKEALMQNSMKSNRKDQDNLIIPVKIRGDIIEIQWNQTLETWELCDEHIKIPKTGNFKIGKGIDKNYNRNTRHELNKLNRMKYCIDSLKENSNFSGGKTLVDLVNPQLNHTPKLNDNSKSQNTTNELTSFKNILNKYEMMTFFNRFDSQQKKVIEEIFDQNVVILNGEGGSGKTEIAAFIALFYILLEKRVLISTETRNALDNILFRISKISKRIQNSTLFTNIIRLENHSPSYEIDTLEQWGMSKEVQKITKQIIGKTQNIQENNKESNKENSRENNRENNEENNKANNEKNHLKTSFRNIFTKPRKLERMIAQSYNIILSNYGLICERDYFNDPFQKFDLNIIEASSSSNFSAISTSILNSEKWLFLNDNAQITPLTVGDYLLKQQLRFPNENELDSAVKFDPSDLNLSKTKKIWSNREYGKGVVSLFTQFKTNDNIAFLNLKNQYRINPVLYAALSQAYGKYQSTYPSKKSYRNLSTLSELLNTRSHLKYEIMSQEEILDNMGKRVADLIDSIESSKKNATHLTIGIACTDVISLRKMLNVYRNIKTRGNSLRKNATNHYSEHRNNLNITFCSIKSHQEREYDIFILGILRYGSKNFKYRLYTALSRSSNYTIIFGPSIKSYKKIANNPLQKNKEILNQLEKASHD